MPDMEALIGQKLLLFVLFSLEMTMIETIRTFTPDWVSPPGDTIADLFRGARLDASTISRAFGLHHETYQFAYQWQSSD